jgi:hypothetical protein
VISWRCAATIVQKTSKTLIRKNKTIIIIDNNCLIQERQDLTKEFAGTL